MRLMHAMPCNGGYRRRMPAIGVGGTICAAEKVSRTLDRPDLTSSRQNRRPPLASRVAENGLLAEASP